MENKTLTEEEIKTIKDLQSTRDGIIIELGNIEAYFAEVKARKEELYLELKSLKVKDLEVGKELSDKYGNGSIDLEKGEFIPQD
jgi:hypothetical protein|tara:strand:+ start:309 stop:560 length:252 start_codon:yes stop_codon:yes gene_type:complete